jgi:hypothetical protein
MKVEISATVVVAALAAAASIFGVLYNQNGSLKLERQKWHQTIESERLKLEREAITDFAKTFATAFYLSENMIWRVEMMAGSLTQKDFLVYAKESDALKPKLATLEVMLAATSAVRHERIKAALAEYRRVDENLIITGRIIDANRAEALQLLNDEVKKLSAYRELVLGSLSDAAKLQTPQQ